MCTTQLLLLLCFSNLQHQLHRLRHSAQHLQRNTQLGSNPSEMHVLHSAQPYQHKTLGYKHISTLPCTETPTHTKHQQHNTLLGFAEMQTPTAN